MLFVGSGALNAELNPFLSFEQSAIAGVMQA